MKKFNKFFSTAIAFMILMAGWSNPLTLRAEDKDNKDQRIGTRKEQIQYFEEAQRNGVPAEEIEKKMKEYDIRIKKAEEDYIQSIEEYIKKYIDVTPKDVIGALNIEIQKAKKRIELIDEVAEARKKIAEYDKKEKEALELKVKYEQQAKEADKKIQEADKKYCLELETLIPAMKNYCSKHKCTEEQNKKMSKAQNDYKEICERLVVPAPEEKKEKK